ncbi:MAG: hypothetical protein Q4E67_00600 [Planctomycetia bacterium]|nr:hypothetical protein [Planctomycetia bacterium]
METQIYKNLITILNPEPIGLGGRLLLTNDRALADKILDVESSISGLQSGLTTYTVEDAAVSITLAENVSYYLSHTELTSVTVAVGTGVHMSRVELTTGTALPTFTWPAGLIFVGNGCVDGVWTPEVSTRYSILVSQSFFGTIANVLVVPTLATA